MAARVKDAKVVTRLTIVLILLLWRLFIEFPRQVVKIITGLGRLPTHHLILVEKAVRATGHGLSIPIDQATNLIKQFAVAPDEVHVVDELLDALIGRTELAIGLLLLSMDLMLERLQIHRFLHYEGVVWDA